MKRLVVALCPMIVILALSITLLFVDSSRIYSQANQEPPEPWTSSIDREIADLLANPSNTADLTEAAPVAQAVNLTDVHVMPQYVTVPSILPRVAITKDGSILAPGYYFLTSFSINTPDDPNSLLIVDSDARLVYYKLMPNNRFLDLDRHGTDTLAYFSPSVGGFEVLDNRYNLIETWLPGNGYAVVDEHELQTLQNGNVVFLIYDPEVQDMTQFGGRPNAEVVHLVIQEMDRDHNVVFEWDSRDHFLITDTYASLTGAEVDYVHANAIEEDDDGNFLLSNRHMSEITKIDRTTGDIIWRMGGKHNEFTFVGEDLLPDVGAFSYQHDVRRLPNGHITIFDNANQFNDAGANRSRGVEYEVNEVTKVVTRVHEFRLDPDVVSTFMGSVQRFDNGATLVGWGGGRAVAQIPRQPVTFAEFNAAGDNILQGAFLESSRLSYRVRKYTWQGFPTYPPTLVYTDTGTPALYYSWNGATEVISYTVLAGVTPDALGAIATRPKTDFEDSTPLDGLDPTLCFFSVIPIVTVEAQSIPSQILYPGDDFCSNALTSDSSGPVSRSYTYSQTRGPVTATVTLLPGGFVSPTIVVQGPESASVAAAPVGQAMSNVQFTLRAFIEPTMEATSTLSGDAEITIAYANLDLSRSPTDVNLFRWDEESQSWTDDGLTLLARNVVEPSVTYALDKLGDFALFVANSAPQSAPATVLIHEDTTYTFTADALVFFDADGDALSGIVIDTLPLTGALTYSGTAVTAGQVITTGALAQLSFTPTANQFGTPYASFDFRVRDIYTQSVPYSFTIGVGAVNDAPVAVDDAVLPPDAGQDGQATAASFSVPIDVLSNDSDVDGDTLRIVSVTQPAHGSATVSGDQIVYTTSEFFEDEDSFAYTITDGHGGEASATVTVRRTFSMQYFPFVGH